MKAREQQTQLQLKQQEADRALVEITESMQRASMQKTEVEKVLGPRLVGEPLDEATLDMAHDAVLEMLVEKFKELEGLREYLDALKYVGQLPV